VSAGLNCIALRGIAGLHLEEKMAISGVKLAEECMTVYTDIQKLKA
jgi:hypothetical protein